MGDPAWIFKVITLRKNDFKICFGNCEDPNETREKSTSAFLFHGGFIHKHVHKPIPLKETAVGRSAHVWCRGESEQVESASYGDGVKISSRVRWMKVCSSV